jgi:hypothetical protein
MNTKTYLSTSISDELSSAEFGDKRLTKRLGKIVDAISARPSDGFPDAVGTTAALEGMYRFLRNEKVDSDKILFPHFQQTKRRCIESKNVLVISDTSTFCYALNPTDPKTKREGLGPITKWKQGFFGHFAFAISQEEALPLGVLGLETFVRTGDKGRRASEKILNDPTRESCKWLRVVEEVEERLENKVNVIHLADRQADFYEFLNYFVDHQKKCIVRVAHNRRLHPDEEFEMMYDKLTPLEAVYEREVPLSKRRSSKIRMGRKNQHPPRGYRMAKLSFSACPVEIIGAKYLHQKCNPSLKLNLVHIQEIDCPKNEEPVNWKLITTESISTTHDIVEIVDNYRKRWSIEEYFKALKDGCLAEERQLESLDTLLNGLAILIPVAWKLLLMRSLARTKADESACYVLTQTQIKVIKACSRRKVGEIKTIKDALYAVAGMGGHIPNNGIPGWKVLGRGYQKILLLEEGWLAHEGKM